MISLLENSADCVKLERSQYQLQRLFALIGRLSQRSFAATLQVLHEEPKLGIGRFASNMETRHDVYFKSIDSLERNDL